jgi:hypothetical protein
MFRRMIRQQLQALRKPLEAVSGRYSVSSDSGEYAEQMGSACSASCKHIRISVRHQTSKRIQIGYLDCDGISCCFYNIGEPAEVVRRPATLAYGTIYLHPLTNQKQGHGGRIIVHLATFFHLYSGLFTPPVRAPFRP